MFCRDNPGSLQPVKILLRGRNVAPNDGWSQEPCEVNTIQITIEYKTLTQEYLIDRKERGKFI